jgi:hypothetical protein
VSTAIAGDLRSDFQQFEVLGAHTEKELAGGPDFDGEFFVAVFMVVAAIAAILFIAHRHWLHEGPEVNRVRSVSLETGSTRHCD